MRRRSATVTPTRSEGAAAPGGCGIDPSGTVSRLQALERSTGYGLTGTLVGGVLLALAYYGVVSIRGARDIGQALPAPFYLLAIAFLFVLELLRRRDRIVLGIGRAIAFAAVYGSLFVLAAAGGAYR